MSDEEKSIFDILMERLEKSDFEYKNIPAWELGKLSIDAFIRNHGGTVNEDLDYAQADARHWHQAYLKTKEKLQAYKDYVEALKTRIEELRDTIEEIDQPLAADHPAIIDAEKSGYERGWDAAREELNTVASENRDIFEELKVITKERDGYANDVAHLKTILEETREEVQNNLRIHSEDVYRLKEEIKVLTRQLRWHEDNSAKWRDEMTTWLKEMIQEILDGK